MKSLVKKAKYVLEGQEGASNVEIIVWISIVLVLATVLFAFKDQIKNFITRAGARVDGLSVN